MANPLGWTAEVSNWVQALAANGAFVVESSGRGDATPSVKRLVESIHDALAGGDGAVRGELDKKFEAAMKSLNCMCAHLADGDFTP
jgi:hypothetical protein